MNALFPHLSEATLKARTYYLSKLGIDKPGDWTVLRDIPRITAAVLSSENVYTRNTRLSHILEFLKAIGKVIPEYTRLFDENYLKFQERKNNNTVESDPHGHKYRPVPELIETLKNSKSSPRNRFLVGVYLTMPPMRNDLSGVQVVYKLSDTTRAGNYLVMSRQPYFYLQQYKTAGLYGAMKIPLSSYVHGVLRDNPEVMSVFELSENALSKAVKRASKSVLGTDYTINNYRHMAEMHLQSSPEYSQMTISERTKAHARLAHSHSTGLAYGRVSSSS